MNKSSAWFGLIIGNTRLHWAAFAGGELEKTWHTPHLTTVLSQVEGYSDVPLYLASVVPSQTLLCRNYPHLQEIELAQIPLNQLYPTLGIDRALAALGTGEVYGFPGLTIDVGTALTLTGIDSRRNFSGGAILPGFRLQFQALSSQTAALPEGSLPQELPSLWADTTPTAIESGIVHTILAGVHYYITDWLGRFPDAVILLTGGDSLILFNYLLQLSPNFSDHLRQDDRLSFWGMRSIVLSL
jgi:type III pantothenate kinase